MSGRSGRDWRRPAALAAIVGGLTLTTLALAYPVPGSVVTTTARPGTAIADLVALPGDRTIMLAEGTYTGGEIDARRAAAEGEQGWVVIAAPHRHGAEVDLGGRDLVLGEGVQRVLFVGLRFTNGRVVVSGEDIGFWYTAHTFPRYDVITSPAAVPRMFRIERARRVALRGVDFHDGNASALTMRGVEDVVLEGARFWDIAERPGTDPHDFSHVNLISSVGGDIRGLTVRHSHLVGARINHQTDGGDVVDLVYEDVWYELAEGSAFQFNATEGNAIRGRRSRVVSWDHRGRNPRDRRDTVDGTEVAPGARPDRVDVVDEEIRTDAPVQGLPDPATRWRAANPYDSWSELLERSAAARWGPTRLLAGSVGLLLLGGGVGGLVRRSARRPHRLQPPSPPPTAGHCLADLHRVTR